MKKKIIFLMMLLTFIEGLSMNSLKAQDVVTIGGDATSYSNIYPIGSNYSYGLSQHTYTAAEINHAGGKITHIAFKVNVNVTRNVTFYLQHTTVSALSGWESFSDENKVYYNAALNTANEDGWLTVELDTPFEYDGTSNILLTAWDNTGSSTYTWSAGCAYIGNAGRNATAYVQNSSPVSTSSAANISTRQPSIRFTFAEPEDDLIPATPTGLVATTINHNSIELTWDEAENAKSYNVYQNETFVKKVTTTSYLVDGLDAETTYSFTVTSVRGSKESDPSNEASATTAAAPKTRNVVFTLTDSYGDGWNGGTLSVSTNDGYSETLTHTNGKEVTYTRAFSQGAVVTVKFNAGSYSDECSYCIRYEGGDENIVCSATYGLVDGSNTYSFTIESTEPSVSVNTDAVALGNVRLGDYWTEKAQVSQSFEVVVKHTSLTAISCDNDFFTLQYDANAKPIEVSVSYNKNATTEGEQTGSITITTADLEPVVVTLSATAYTAVEGDAIEDPITAKFNRSGVYTHTATGMKDDYILPDEENDGLNGDAVYAFELTTESVLSASVEGTNGNVAIYKAEDLEGNGPSSNNNYEGVEVEVAPTAPTTFFYDFEDGSLEDFTLVEYDGNNSIWSIAYDNASYSNAIRSYSYSYSGGVYVGKADNYIITNTKYYIGEDSKLSFDSRIYSTQYPDKVMVKVSSDGATFQLIETVSPGSTYYNSFTVDLGAKFAELGIAYGEYQIALHHQDTYQEHIYVDNLRLSDGSAKTRNRGSQIDAVQYPAGSYYAVAAAEGDFTLTLTRSTLPTPEAVVYTAPENGATNQENPLLSWTFGKYTKEYQVLLGTTNPPTEVLVDWTSDLVTLFQTEGLQNNTQYYWQVNTRNDVGVTEGEVYSFVTPLEVPSSVYADLVNLRPGEYATLHWAEPSVTDGLLYYNVYLNGVVMEEEVEDLQYEFYGLTRNDLNANELGVTAVYELGESEMAMAYVYMVGDFDLTVNVTDGDGNPLEGATVELSNGYDEMGNMIEPYVFTTDANGQINKKVLSLDYNYYLVTVSKELYGESISYLWSYNTSAGSAYSMSFTLNLAKPDGVTAPNGIYVGESATIAWNPIGTENATYNVYVDGTMHNAEALADTTYTISDLAYGNHTVTVTAAHELGETPQSDPVYIQVAGNFTLTVNVTDGTNPIEGAVVTIESDEWTYDELGYPVPTYEATTTDVNGVAVIENVRLLISSNNGYSNYTVKVSKGLYNESYAYITNYITITNGQNYTVDVQMTLPAPMTVVTDKEYYFVGEDVVLSWDAPQFNTRAFLGYNVYKMESYYGESVKLNEEIITDTTYTVSDLAYGTYYFNVTAVYDEGESTTVQTYAQVTDYGKVAGTVVDADGKIIKGAEVEITGYDQFSNEQTYYFTSDENGEFTGSLMLTGYYDGYTVRAQKFNYADYESLNSLNVEYGIDANCEIVMESLPTLAMTVTAAEYDEEVMVSWDAPQDAAAYNVYRKDADENVTKLNEEALVATYSYSDTLWTTLPDGEYVYGVSAIVEKGLSITEGFENGIPSDWAVYNKNGSASNYDWKQANTAAGISPYEGTYLALSNNNSSYSTSNPLFLVTSLIDITEVANPKVSFAYYTPSYSSTGTYSSSSYTNTLSVLILTEAEGQNYAANSTSQVWTNNGAGTNNGWWATATVDLSAYQGQKVYIAFKSIPRNGKCSAIDYVQITGEGSSSESGVVWAAPLVKGGIVFEGEGDWNEASNWSSGVVPTAEDDVTIKGNAVVTGEVEVNSIVIAKNNNSGMEYGEEVETYSLTLEAGSVLRVGKGISNSNASALVINDGAQLFQNNEDVKATFNMIIQNPSSWDAHKEGWQIIASPLSEALVSSFKPMDSDYDLYKYDGTKELQWVNHKQHVKGGDEFMYDFENGYMPSFTQIDVDGDGYDWGIPSYGYADNYTMNLGASVIGSNYCLYSEALSNADNYLVMPKSKIIEGSYLKFKAASYYSQSTAQQYFYGDSETVEILVSENGNSSVADFVSIKTINVTNGSTLYTGLSWAEFTVDLSAYADKEIYIALRHNHATSGYSQMLLVDNLQLVSGAWEMFDEEFVQGRGYLASYETETTATFTGVLNTNKTFGFKEVTYNAEDRYANFHLIGNPFTFNMDWASMNLTNVYNGYATVNEEGTYNYHTEGTINVGDGFFVQATGEEPVMRYGMRAGRAKAASVSLVASGDNGSDNVVISLAGENEGGFVKLDNFNTEVAEIYVIDNGSRYGIKSYDENVAEVEVRFAAKQMGSYTINAIPEGNFSSVILVDRMTGIETNLLMEGYTFTATSKDAYDRFVVRFDADNANNGDNFVYQSGDDLIIDGAGSVQIIDVMGRIVYSSDVESCNNRINVSGLKKAAYMVRSVNGNEVKTQKIVVL